MSRNIWILAGLMAVFSLILIYRGESGMTALDFAKCKESLVIQMFTSTCTELYSVGGTAAVMNGDARQIRDGGQLETKKEL